MSAPIHKVVDTREGIFKRHFRVRVRQIDLIDEEEIERFGMISTGDREWDRVNALNKIETLMSIDTMLEKFFRKGLGFGIVRYQDTKIIYELIQDHLKAWQAEIERSWDVRHAPLQDLIDLDKLASAVYTKARFLFNHDALRSGLYESSSNRYAEALGLGVLFMTEKSEDSVESPQERDPHDHIPKRSSLEELFAARLDEV